MTNKEIRYQTSSGFTGVVYGKSSLVICDANGEEIMHTASRTVNTREELKELVDDFEAFYNTLQKLWNYGGIDESEGAYDE